MLFVAAAGMLNRLCLVLAPPTLAVLLGYSYAKRFTAAAHLWLGVALGLAPIGAWIAETGSLALPPLVLAGAVTMWVAGFDVIYSLQDEDFDRRRGLRSLPAAVGGRRALMVARLFHGAALAGFVAFAIMAGGGWLRLGPRSSPGRCWCGSTGWSRPMTSRRVDAAFFTANGVLAVVMCVLFLLARC